MAITDAFTNTNGTLLSAHGNWARVWGVTGAGTMEINTNSARCTPSQSAEIGYRRTDGTFPNTQASQITLVGVTTDGLIGPATLMQSGAASGYGFYVDGSSCYTFEVTAETWVQKATSSRTNIDNDVLVLSSASNTHTPTINGSGTGTPGAFSDSSFTSGFPGLTGFAGGAAPTRGDSFSTNDLSGGGGGASILRQIMNYHGG